MVSLRPMCPHRKPSRMCTTHPEAAIAVTLIPVRQVAGISPPSKAVIKRIRHQPTRAAAPPALSCNSANLLRVSGRSLRGRLETFAFQQRHVMKLACVMFLTVGSVVLGNAQASRPTPAEQRIAAATQQIDAHPKQAEGYNDLALAFISRAHESLSPDYDRQAAEAIAAGFRLAPQDFQLRKTHVALLLDQRDFAQARDEAKALNLHNPDDATVHGYLARAYIGLGNYQEAEASAQWMLNLQPFNVPGLLIAADLREHYGDPEGALEVLDRAYAETSPSETGELASIANRIAAIEIGMGKLDSASQMLRRADEVFPGYPETIKNRARVGVGSTELSS